MSRSRFVTQLVVLLPMSLSAACVVGDEAEDEDLVIEGGATATLTFVQHNVEKKDGPIANAIEEAKRVGAIGVSLQEVCPLQVDELRRMYGGQWTIGEVAGHKARTGCPRPDGTEDAPSDVVIYTGGTGGDVTAYDYLADGQPAAMPGGAMVCVAFKRAKTPIHFCSTHLTAGDYKDPVTGTVYDGSTWREKQTASIKRIARDNWFGGAKNHFGVVAGDFNGKPSTTPLNNMYDAGMYAAGAGDFTEYNRSGAGRDGRDTSTAAGDGGEDAGFARKIDYVFYSTNRAAKDGPAVVLTPDGSDHDMVTSTVNMRK